MKKLIFVLVAVAVPSLAGAAEGRGGGGGVVSKRDLLQNVASSNGAATRVYEALEKELRVLDTELGSVDSSSKEYLEKLQRKTRLLEKQKALLEGNMENLLVQAELETELMIMETAKPCGVASRLAKDLGVIVDVSKKASDGVSINGGW